MLSENDMQIKNEIKSGSSIKEGRREGEILVRKDFAVGETWVQITTLQLL